MKKIITIAMFAVAFFALFFIQKCHDKQTNNDIKPISTEAEKELIKLYESQLEKYKNAYQKVLYASDSLKKENAKILLLAHRNQSFTRERIIHDTIKQRFRDTSYCEFLEGANNTLWDLHLSDSSRITKLEEGMLIRDTMDAVRDSMFQSCGVAWAKEAKNARNAEARLNRESFRKSAWKTITLVASGVLVYFGVSK